MLALLCGGCAAPVTVSMRNASRPILLGPVQQIGGEPRGCAGAGPREKAHAGHEGWSFSTAFIAFSTGRAGPLYKAHDRLSPLHRDVCVDRVTTDAHDAFIPVLILFITRRSADVTVEGVVMPETAEPVLMEPAPELPL